MTNSFLSQEYVALALIKAKFKILDESFATTSELNQFTMFMQQKFNEQELDITIVHRLGTEDFSVNDGIVKLTNKCCFNLDMLSSDILDILTDESLILNFFMEFEKRKLEVLEKFQLQNSNSCTREKPKSLILSKKIQ